MDTKPRTRLDGDRGQQGAALLLALFVLMVLLVVAVQVRFAARVEADFSQLALQSSTMGRLADAARQQALSTLLMDLENSEDPGADTAHPLASAAGAADIVSQTDSTLDEWTDSTALAPAMGDGLTLFIEVVDEDSKINLLGMWTEDEDTREDAREIVQRLLDIAFEGTSRDLSYSDATDIIDRLDDWVKGRRGGSYEDIPVPKLKKSAEESDEEGAFELIESTLIDDEDKNYPLSLGELLLIEGVEPGHLNGFVENDVFHPGLAEYLTTWSNLELLPPPTEEDVFASSPFAQGPSASGGGFGGEDADAEAEAEEEREELTAQATYDGLVNINTARLTVLRAIARQEIPVSSLELIEEFREKIDELESENATASGMFEDLGGGNSSGNPEDGQDGQEGEEDGEDEIAKYVFADPGEVFNKVEEEFNVAINADDLAKDEFIRWFSVQSQVFTVKILVREPSTDIRGTRETMGPHRWYRTTVWRMVGSDRPRMITLMPLEPYHDPRRLVDLPEDLSDISDERFLDRPR